MKRLSKFLFIVALLGLLTLSAVAQQGGEGGTIVESNIGGDPATYNPIISNDTVSGNITDFLYPDIVGLDPATLEEQPLVAGNLAESWEFDETGTKVTIKFRQGLTWGDGTPITAADYMYAFNAVKSGLTSSPRTYVFYQLDDGTKSGGNIVSAEQLDDYTIVFTLGTVVEDADGNIAEIKPNCIAFSDINDIPVVPSHVYSEQFGTDYAAMDADPLFLTQATWGTFKDPLVESGVQVSLVADQNYSVDAQLGYVNPGEYLLLNVPDTTVEYERFLAGELSLVAISPDRQNEIRGREGFQFFERPSNGYTYMGYNLADPTNPQNGLDEEGNRVDQGIHPIFGDKLVRQALAHAVDVQSMVGTRPDGSNPATGILEGNGAQAVVHNHPVSWVDPGLEPYAFDPEMAKSMLAEAGWVDGDGDGILECQDCLYARTVDSAYNGTKFEFSLKTNAGNKVRERTGQSIKDQLASIGVTVNFEAIDFPTLVAELQGQAFDAIIIGWNLGLPFDPDARWAFGASADLVDAGFGFTSYSNPEAEKLWEDATSVAGCDPEVRADMYRQAMQMLYDDQPYMWLFYGNAMIAAQGNIENFDPYAFAETWNIDAWAIKD